MFEFATQPDYESRQQAQNADCAWQNDAKKLRAHLQFSLVIDQAQSLRDAARVTFLRPGLRAIERDLATRRIVQVVAEKRHLRIVGGGDNCHIARFCNLPMNRLRQFVNVLNA